MSVNRFSRPDLSAAVRQDRTRPSHRRTHIEPLERRLLLSAGDLDPSFGLGGMTSVPPAGFAHRGVGIVDAANGLVAYGGFAANIQNSDATYADARVLLTVVDSAGNPLKSFSGDGVATQALSIRGGVIDLYVAPDNKIVVLAGNETGQRVLTRFNANGSLDATFGQKTIALAEANDIARAPNGDIVVIGKTAATVDGRIKVLRYSPGNGTLKSQFTTTMVGDARDVVVQSDGRPLIAAFLGNTDDPNGTTTQVVIRLKGDYSGLDTTFGGGDGVASLAQTTYAGDFGNAGAELELDGQGRIVTAFAGDNDATTVRRLLPANGAIDASFTPSQAGIVYDMAIAANGKITLSGIGFPDSFFLTRVNANGGVDTSFGNNGALILSGPYQEVYFGLRHDVQPDGRIVSGYDQQTVVRLVADNATPVGSATLGTDGVVRVVGTAGRDDIGFYYNVGVTVNGRTFFWGDGATRIDVSTFDGSDNVDDSSITYNPGASRTSDDDLPRTVHTGAGNDYVEGGGGKDVIAAEDGNDVIQGFEGDDTIIDGPGTDRIIGGLGADTVDYSFRSGPVYVDLQGDADDGPTGEHDTVMPSIEHIIGSKGNDTLIGDGRPNYIDGRGGNDTIYGGGGNDTLFGGLGQDKLYGQDGNDFLDAKDGITDLVLDGGAGTDTARKDNSDPRTSVEVLFNG